MDKLVKKKSYSLDDYKIEIKTIEEGKAYIDKHSMNGVECPCCERFLKIYKRPITSTMARMIIKLYHLGGEWHHVRIIAKGISDTGTNDFSKLAYWELIKQGENNNPKKKNSGNWKITKKGKKFVLNQILVSSHAYVYNKNVLEFEGTDTTIIKSLGKDFDYSELMKNV
jgi:hypothetical protein